MKRNEWRGRECGVKERKGGGRSVRYCGQKEIRDSTVSWGVREDELKEMKVEERYENGEIREESVKRIYMWQRNMKRKVQKKTRNAL